jgi:ferredoxin--NADP+ reductase
LVQDNLLPGKNLYLFATGTGLAPFMSIIKDHEVYERYEKVILIHGVRHVSELGYQDYIEKELPENEFFGEEVRNKLIYYPTVTREPFRNQGRLTDLIKSGKLSQDIGLPQINPENDRVLICGSPSMLKESSEMLNDMGFIESPRMGEPAHYAIERAFVEK